MFFISHSVYGIFVVASGTKTGSIRELQNSFSGDRVVAKGECIEVGKTSVAFMVVVIFALPREKRIWGYIML